MNNEENIKEALSLLNKPLDSNKELSSEYYYAYKDALNDLEAVLSLKLFTNTMVKPYMRK